MADTFPSEIHAEAPSSFKSLAQSTIEFVDTLKIKIRMNKEQLGLQLLEDSEFAELSERMQEIRKKYKSRKNQLLSIPKNDKIAKELEKDKEMLKEEQLSLSSYLLGYHEDTKKNEIADAEGRLRKFKRQAKISK